MADPSAITVRVATPEDRGYATHAVQLIADAAKDNDIAVRGEAMLRGKIETGRAAIALDGSQLVGFGYFADWGGATDGTRAVSHSGLVVDPGWQGHGIGRLLKEQLFQASLRLFPNATTISLTTSKAVMALNESLGFERCEFDEMSADPAFWAGCKTCRNYEQMQNEGKRCCCIGMIRRPDGTTPGEATDPSSTPPVDPSA